MLSPHIRVLVVEDERPAREGLCAMLRRADPELAVTECGDADSAVRHLRSDAVDLVLLDVRLRGATGFDVIKAVGVEQMPVTVFTTAFDQYALRAFEACALDYLLKPIGEERLQRVLGRARDAVRQKRLGAISAQLAQLLQAVADGGSQDPVPDDLRRILVRTGVSSYYIDLADVSWVEAADNYSRFWTGGRSHLVRVPLAQLEERLVNAGFVRTHRTALIRSALIQEVRTTGRRRFAAVLVDGTRVPTSRERRANVLAAMHKAQGRSRANPPVDRT